MGEVATRYFIRFAVPGGYAVLIGIYYEAVYGWAWSERVEELISIARSEPLTTLGGAIVVGFVLYQVYCFCYQPLIALPARLGRGRALVIVKRRIPDLGGAALEGLRGVAGAERFLIRTCGLRHELAPHELPANPTAAQCEHHAEVIDEHRDMLDALLQLLADSGQAALVRSYSNALDIYHVLGASLAALVVITAAAILDIAAIHAHAFAMHPERSIEATLLSTLLFAAFWRVLASNRRKVARSMSRRLRNGLSMWAQEHPEVFAAHRDTRPESRTSATSIASPQLTSTLSARVRRGRRSVTH